MASARCAQLCAPTCTLAPSPAQTSKRNPEFKKLRHLLDGHKQTQTLPVRCAAQHMGHASSKGCTCVVQFIPLSCAMFASNRAMPAASPAGAASAQRPAAQVGGGGAAQEAGRQVGCAGRSRLRWVCCLGLALRSVICRHLLHVATWTLENLPSAPFHPPAAEAEREVALLVSKPADKAPRRREQLTAEERKRALKRKRREEREARELAEAHSRAKVVSCGRPWCGLKSRMHLCHMLVAGCVNVALQRMSDSCTGRAPRALASPA